jgi:quaternary ammonium compound-resistance protein SugE
MAWLWLITAGVFEICFAIMLKLSDGFSKPLYTILFAIAALLSFYTLTKAMQSIPVGTAYAIWTGIGSFGVALLGIVLFSEPLTGMRIFFISTLIASIVGLKLVS